MQRLPRTPRDLFRFGPVEGPLYALLIGFFRLTGLWRHPIAAQGDFSRMGFLDKVYWVYKTTHPMRRARRRSGLEEHFARQDLRAPLLPSGFDVLEEITLSAAGDLIHHPYLASSTQELYADARVREALFGADLPMANLECPIAAADDVAFEFDSRRAPLLVYDRASFDCVRRAGARRFLFLSTACNHSLDFGEAGVERTLAALEAEGIAQHGLNRSQEEALRPTIVETRGLRIAMVAYTFGLNAHEPPPERPWLVNAMRLNDGVAANDFRQLRRQLDVCAREDVDFTIAHLHWGMEHELYPTPRQVELAHHLAELGIDAIIGHHPHVIQPVELYRTRRDPRRVVPVYYSLGNLVNAFSAPYLCRSRIAQLRLAKGRDADGVERTYVSEAGMLDVEQRADEATRTISLRPSS